MSTILHLKLALSERRLRRRMREPVRVIRALPPVSNAREAEDGGYTWPEIAAIAVCAVGTVLAVVL